MTAPVEVVKNDVLYRVEGEAGRYEFTSHVAMGADGNSFDTGKEFFSPLANGKERYRTIGFKELALIYGCAENSYRKTAALINRVRRQPKGTPQRTLCDIAEHEGEKLRLHLKEKTEMVLCENGFTPEGNPPEDFKIKGPLPKQDASTIGKAMRQLELSEKERRDISANPVPYENEAEAVCVSIDDVGVKRQKENRGDNTANENKRKTVKNTVIHVHRKEKSYVLGGTSVVNALQMFLGILVHNELLGKSLIFFTDGERSLKNHIFAFFKWHGKLILILDWYHLRKKCTELLSMAMKGKNLRNEVLTELTRLLWLGLVDQAVNYLKNLDPAKIKNQKSLELLIGYFERNRTHIPCYAVRKQLELRNSSNRVEKSNDLLVAERQKHNSMSWSEDGSFSLTAIKMIKCNGESRRWLTEGRLALKLVA